jgi:uncharacterized protein YigA (DUF484 family)
MTNPYGLSEAEGLLKFVELEMRPLLQRIAALERRVDQLERNARHTGSIFAMLHKKRIIT